MRRFRRSSYIDNTAIKSWGYLGLAFWFALPILGTIPAIIIAFCARNINLKNFARAFCIAYVAFFALALVGVLACILLGVDIASLFR